MIFIFLSSSGRPNIKVFEKKKNHAHLDLLTHSRRKKFSVRGLNSTKRDFFRTQMQKSENKRKRRQKEKP